jgi:WD40 repeat protein
VLSLSYSPGGDRILSTGFDGFLRVWDAETSLPLVSNFDSNAVLFSVASYDHRGDKIVSVSMLTGQIRVLDAVDGRVIWSTQMTSMVSSVAFSSDDAFVAVGAEDGDGDNAVCLLDSETGEIIRTFDKAYSWPIIAVSFSPDGKYIVSANEFNVSLWDVERGTLIYQLEDIGGFVLSAAFSPDGRRIMAATERIVYLWDAATGERISGQEEYEWEISSVVFSPDGKPVAIAETYGYFLINDAETGALINILYAGFEEHEFTDDEKKRLYSDFVD